MSAHVHQIVVNKKRPDADRAAALMKELVRNIEPVLVARKWSVQRLIEMCCCTSHRGPKSDNVHGYCQATGNGRSAVVIALRLRRPRSHEFVPFDDCFGTLVHEVAHITHLKHSAPFYQLMDSIEKHWQLSKSKGFAVVDEKGFPIHGGHKLPPAPLQHGATPLGGGGRGDGGRAAGAGGGFGGGQAAGGNLRALPSREEVRRRCLEAAVNRGKTLSRMKQLGLGRAYTLGGGGSGGGSDGGSSSGAGSGEGGAAVPKKKASPLTLDELRQARMNHFRRRDAAYGLADEELDFNASQDGLAIEGACVLCVWYTFLCRSLAVRMAPVLAWLAGWLWCQLAHLRGCTHRVQY
jgi:hypothetical protein